jgi:hypothetical protein
MWQNSYSQLLHSESELYPEIEIEEYLPPYDPNVIVITPIVEKWMNEQLAKSGEKRTVEMKTDVLGRVKKIIQGIRGIETKQIEEPKQKRLINITEMHKEPIEIEPIYGRYEYNNETKEFDYYLNDKKISAKEYEIFMKKYYEKLDSQTKGKRNLPIPGVVHADELSWTALMTAEELSALINNYKELSIEDHREIVGGATVSSILSTIQLSTLGHEYGYDGDGIGIYVKEPSCMATNPSLVDKNRYTNLCSSSNGTGYHHNRVVNIVQKAAPKAYVFGLGYYDSDPSSPPSYSPPIEIGNHSYMQCIYPVTNDEAKRYKNIDLKMDEYIYKYGVINFVCAGNKESLDCSNGCSPCDTTRYVASPGKALNAITVGAVDPATNEYTTYSQWQNSEIINAKPELAMYTNIGAIDNGYADFGGCSAATPLAAGFTASLLEQHPFFKRKPALVKAVLLSGEAIRILNFDRWDRDNANTSPYVSRVAEKIMTYSNVNGTRYRDWSSPSNTAFFDSNDEIVFTENNIKAGTRYRIAIAWLSDGSYVNANKIPPQNINLYIQQNGKSVNAKMSMRDPFEVADFYTASNANGPLTIKIHRYSNSGAGGVYLGYSMREY